MKFLFLAWKHPVEPLGLLYISSILKKNNHQTKVAVIGQDDLNKVVSEFKPDIVAGSVMTGGQTEFLKITNELKKNNNFLCLVGGSHPTFHPQVIEEEGCDIIAQGECEEAIAELANNLQKNKDITKIKNLWVKKNGKIYKNEIRNLNEKLDTLPFPDREVAYEHKIWRDEPIRHFIACRGCAYKCTYCFVEDTNIITKNGIKKIKDVKLNDEILTHKGVYCKTNLIFQRPYSGDLIIIKINNKEIKCTPNHKFFVLKKSENKPRFVKAKNLEINDTLLTPKFNNQSTFELILEEISIKNENQILIQDLKIKNKRILINIEKIKKERYDGYVYNLSIDNIHSYSANGVSVHNCFNSAIDKIYGGKGKWVRWRSVDNLISEIKEVITKYGGKVVYFQDDIFIMNKPWLKEFAEKYKKEINLPFHCHVRPNLVDEISAKLLKEAGCYSVHMALEAADDYIRNVVIKREMDKETVYKACKLLNEYNIKIMLQNILGLPESSLETDLETLKMNIECKPLYAWCSIFQPYPSLPLTEYAANRGLLEGDYKDIGPKFFETTIVKLENKNEIEHLQKWFAIAASYPLVYKSGLLKLLIKMPHNKYVKNVYKYAYNKFRNYRDNQLYGIKLSSAS